jgi:4-hydroxymandelate oxidase
MSLAAPLPPLDRLAPQVRAAADYERLARAHLAPERLAYLLGGAGDDWTAQANRRAFAHWALQPRLLADTRAGHLNVALPGAALAHPIGLAPVAHQRLAHPDAELESARAAAATDSLLVASTLSSEPMEAIAAQAGERKWFQLYLQQRREDSLALLRRAEAAGFSAIVLTLDATLQQPSRAAMEAGFVMPPECQAANLARFAPPDAIAAPSSGPGRVLRGLTQGAPHWDDVDWLRQQTRLPLWAKGVLHPQDALALKAHGMDGVVVSNHGGRTLDGALASLHALRAVREALGPDFPLLFDGGVRSGADAFKALALGANAVLVGRLQPCALAVAGALGVAHMLKLLREELEACMALAGCASPAAITAQCLVRAETPMEFQEPSC